jgi:hypothetical protein
MFLALALCFFVGCEEQNAPPPAAAKVSGTVNLDGKPMQGGAVRFNVAGQPPKELPVTNGAFSGEAYVGLNVIDVIWDKEGGSNPMDPSSKMMVNAVDAKFSGPASPFQEAVGAEGKSDLKFDVTSAKK